MKAEMQTDEYGIKIKAMKGENNVRVVITTSSNNMFRIKVYSDENAFSSHHSRKDDDGELHYETIVEVPFTTEENQGD